MRSRIMIWSLVPCWLSAAAMAEAESPPKPAARQNQQKPAVRQNQQKSAATQMPQTPAASRGTLEKLQDKAEKNIKEIPAAINRLIDTVEEAKEEADGAAESPPTEDDLPANWESSSEGSGQETGETSVATEITKGVRVEDIVEPPAEYHYAAFGKPDPFVPPLPLTTSGDRSSLTAESVEIPIVSALQRFPLDRLTVVGIWQLSKGERKAMVMTPSGDFGSSGQGVIVKYGDPIGNRGGKILAIGGDYLLVREFFLAPDGARQFEDKRMPMVVPSPSERPAKLLFNPGEVKPKEVESKLDLTPQSTLTETLDAKLPAPLKAPEGLPPPAAGAEVKALPP